MPKKSKEGLTKHTLFLFEGDMDELRTLHPHQSAAEIIRALVRSYIKSVRAKIEREDGETHVNLRIEDI